MVDLGLFAGFFYLGNLYYEIFIEQKNFLEQKTCPYCVNCSQNCLNFNLFFRAEEYRQHEMYRKSHSNSSDNNDDNKNNNNRNKVDRSFSCNDIKMGSVVRVVSPAMAEGMDGENST